jgi:hypothetical protein
VAQAREQAEAQAGIQLPLPVFACGRFGEGQGAWSDERHIAAQHIPQLGQFIETGCSQKSSHAGNSRIVFHFERRAVLLVHGQQSRLAVFGVDDHRPKFEHAKPTPTATTA